MRNAYPDKARGSKLRPPVRRLGGMAAMEQPPCGHSRAEDGLHVAVEGSWTESCPVTAHRHCIGYFLSSHRQIDSCRPSSAEA